MEQALLGFGGNMPRYAIIINDTVANIIDVTPANLPEGLRAQAIVSLRNRSPDIAVGWTWDGVEFSPPPEPQVPTYTHFSKLQFRQLFTLAERIAIDNAALTGVAKATLVTLQKDIEAAQYVDLSRPDTIAGVNFLVTAGLITAPRAAEVLATRNLLDIHEEPKTR